MTVEQIKQRIRDMQADTDGDVRCVGDRLAFFVDDCIDDDVRGVVQGTLEALLDISQRFLDEMRWEEVIPTNY